MPYFGQLSPDKTSVWGFLIEKAMAKMKGNYYVVNDVGLTLPESIGYLTGVPTFSYTPTAGNTTFFSLILAAYQSQFIITASTPADATRSYFPRNTCGIAANHAYSVVAVFTITASNGTQIQAMMMRNPWGSCNTQYCYNGTMNSTDPFWTAAMISQLPFGVNPVTDEVSYGIWVMPASLFSTCFDGYTIGHYKASLGYSFGYYD